MGFENESYSENPYFFIACKGPMGAGRQLLGRIAAKDGLFTTKLNNEELVIDSFNGTLPFIKLTDVFEIQLTNISGEVKAIPVQYSLTATGSSVLLLSTSSIETINIIDENSEVVKAIRSMGSGIIPSATDKDIQQSSKIIHKFAKR